MWSRIILYIIIILIISIIIFSDNLELYKENYDFAGNYFIVTK